ncbi:hypothetical protein ACQ4M3_28525 [Leptolyngbya sp. AN03gr2]|uniref:hypothetical protein n=1 Tax=unclassified Leptolyngbya TaxID=2650499 RepID=UPI003D3175D8
MQKTALTFSLIAACLSSGVVLPADAIPVQLTQRRRLEFQGWDFYASNISYIASHGKTEARITLNVRNLTGGRASLRADEIDLIRRVVLVDAHGNAYLTNEFDEDRLLGKPFFFGEALAIELSFNTPPALHPRFLLIERSQGDPIRLPL